MSSKAEEFDRLAREVFAPCYPVIARQIMAKTGISQAQSLADTGFRHYLPGDDRVTGGKDLTGQPVEFFRFTAHYCHPRFVLDSGF